MAQSRGANGQFGRAIITEDTLSPGLRKLLPVIDAATNLTFQSFEAKAESQMRSGAPWTDRTSNARNGLKAKHTAVPLNSHTLDLFHTMPYGVYLELRWGGRYAIIGPTLMSIAPQLTSACIRAIDSAVERLG